MNSFSPVSYTHLDVYKRQTLGGGIACLILAVLYIKPLRRSGCTTLVGMIDKEYGHKAGFAATILNSVGTFINILSQLLAASAVVIVIWPTMEMCIRDRGTEAGCRM